MSAHTAQTELKLIGKLILEGELHCETGLHVGAGKGSLEIGGSDNPVVKDAFGRPYIPGSSLRGKIRSLLEQTSGMAVPAELVYLSRRKGQEVRIHQSDRPDDEICLLFGRSPGRMERVQGEALETSQATPARLAVFDAPLDPESITAQMRENLDDELTEVKSENAIDRITSQANPRTLERVPAGARFKTRLRDGRPVRRGCAAVFARARRSAAARRRRPGRRRIARQRTRELRQPEAGLARQELLRIRRGRKGNLVERHAGCHTAGRERSRIRVYPRGVMNPGLIVKLRPTGPWRIGPDSGARNRVDAIYHSDSLYSAVAQAMSRLGALEEWLDATARAATPCGLFQLVLSHGE